MPFDNSYARLPDQFFERTAPTPVAEPSLILMNEPLALDLNLDLGEDKSKLAEYFSGNALLPGSDPIAQAYAGHQFGHFVPQLGDGRAHILGEVVTPDGRRFDIQLKGSGRTRYSRGGDGRSPLGPVIREYIVSEAMHALGVPTTRALAMVTTGETVHRETPHPGGVFTRVARSLVRVGTFEFFAARRMVDELRTLADYVIDRVHPEAREAANPYAGLFRAVCQVQAELIARWMGVGFIHGVMNTDNTALSGETIDFGPCAFMDTYKKDTVFSSIDHGGRYAFNQQPTIAQWNMACLGGCLSPLFSDDEEESRTMGETVLNEFPALFERAYTSVLCAKIGLPPSPEGYEHGKALLRLMEQDRMDFTNSFRLLATSPGDPAPFTDTFVSATEIRAWADERRVLLDESELSVEASAEIMKRANPARIPRNHLVEHAIRAAEDDSDFEPTKKLLGALELPYKTDANLTDFEQPPTPQETVHQTFCGT